MTHGIHNMDLLLWLMGDWDEVRADMTTLRSDIKIEDVSLAMVRFTSGAMAGIVNSLHSPREGTYLRLDFEGATIELRHLYTYTNDDWTYEASPRKEYQERLEGWRALPPEVPPTHASQVSALLECMHRNERPITSGPEARRTIEFLTSMYKAAATGQAIDRGSIGAGDPFYKRIYGEPPPDFRRGARCSALS